MSAFVEDLGSRLLLWAAYFGQLRIVELLVDMGVDVDVADDDEDTSLHLAVEHGGIPMVRALLSVGASVNLKNLENMTPIFYAAENGDEKLIKCLLDAGAGTSDRDFESGFTPLHQATSMNRCPAIELLLAAGSDPNAMDDGGHTPLFWARSEEAIKMLVRWGGRVNVRNKKEETPLYEVVRCRCSVATAALLDVGVDSNAVDKRGQTALHLAAENGDIEIVKHLLQNKSDPDIEDDKGNTPLHIAASRGHVSVFKALIESGARVLPREYYDCRKDRPLPAIEVAFRSHCSNEKQKREMFKAWWDSMPFAYDPERGGDLIPNFDRLSLDELVKLLEDWRFCL